MVKVIFYMFDPDKNGDINKTDMTNFLKILHNEQLLKKNIQTSLQSFEVDRDGTIGFLPVVKWCRRFPSVMEPAFRLQGTVQLHQPISLLFRHKIYLIHSLSLIHLKLIFNSKNQREILWCCVLGEKLSNFEEGKRLSS